MRRVKVILLCLLISGSSALLSQEAYDLQGCLKYALENNHNIRKSAYDLEKSAQARREVLGALLPQVNSTGSLNNNIQKSKFIMPNFINEFLPPAMQDPNAAKYMKIEMGTNFNAGIGATLNQQLVNFSLFNALDISKTAESLTSLALEAKEEDVVAQTANIYYAIQVTEYAVSLFSRSIDIIDSMVVTMEASYANGLVKKVDLDRLKVTRTNLITQKTAMQSTVEIQKNLLKLQMGLDMNQPLNVNKIDLALFESQSQNIGEPGFDPGNQISYKMLQKQVILTKLQRKAAVFETFPVLTAMASYSYNGVCDEFFRGETNYWYGTSVAGLSLRIPIFGGGSRSAKIKQADYEIKKIGEDASGLEQSLSMAYNNALMKLEDNRRTISAQHDNMVLAEEVYRISEANYSQGLASMSDVLNANSSLIQSQMSYADALNNFMKAWIDLRKTSGTVMVLVEETK